MTTQEKQKYAKFWLKCLCQEQKSAAFEEIGVVFKNWKLEKGAEGKKKTPHPNSLFTHLQHVNSDKH